MNTVDRHALRRLATMAFIGIAVAMVSATAIVYVVSFKSLAQGDATVYLAAGERLNAGHDLYRLVPDDRQIPLSPPFWTVPLVSPPPIAVLWRPLAALPAETGRLVWLLGSLVALVGTIVYLARMRPIATALGVTLLAIPLVMEAGGGNVNALLLAGVVAIWAYRDHPATGIILGSLVAVKLWPIVLGAWFVGQRNWPVLASTTATVVVVATLSLVGAGWDNHLDYLGVATGVHVSAFSLSWQLGVPWLWIPVLALGTVAVLATRRRPALSYRIAILTMVLGTPVVNPNTYIILLALLAPPPTLSSGAQPAAGASVRTEVAPSS